MAIDAPKKGRRSTAGRSKAPDEPPSGTTTALADPENNWANKPDSAPYKGAMSLYRLVKQAYQDKEDQSDKIIEYWNIFNAIPDSNQQYTGNSQCYVPAVRDAVGARAKRALGQLFPATGRHVEGVSSEMEPPYTQLSLLEHYIRKLRLKDTVRSDLIAGDVTGQWNLMLDWTKTERTITKLIKRNPVVTQLDDENVEDLGFTDVTEEEEATETEEITEEMPEVVDFATEDLAVVPPTCTNLQKAKAVAIKLKMSKENVLDCVDQGTFILPPGTDIDTFCNGKLSQLRHDPAKKAIHDAGIKTTGENEHFCLVYMVYARLDFDEDMTEEAIIYFADEETIIGLIKNPFWSGKRPVISESVERRQGSFWGRSKIEPVKYLQWNLTDFWNMAQDSAMYTVLPIFRADPLKVPNWAQLTMGLAAVWAGAPADIEPMVTPPVWKDAMPMCDFLERRIWQSLDVNEMMMGRMPSGRKNNAMIGGLQQEQTVSINDHASRYEEVMLNPLVEWLFELDAQFRTTDLMIEQRGEIGAKAAVQTIPVQQWGARYFFRWLGTQAALGVQMLQQQIAWMNVLKGIPPQQLGGRTLDVTPIMVMGTENIFGPDMAPKILIDSRNQFTIDPDVENEILHNAMPVDVHEADDDVKHLQAHMRAAGLAGDPLGLYKAHMGAHMGQRQRKLEMQAMAQGQLPAPGQPGAPGGPGGGPGSVPPMGVAGTPRPGAQPGIPRGTQNPPGAIQTDNAIDGSVVGRG